MCVFATGSAVVYDRRMLPTAALERIAFSRKTIMTSWHSHAENEASGSSRDVNGLSLAYAAAAFG